MHCCGQTMTRKDADDEKMGCNVKEPFTRRLMDIKAFVACLSFLILTASAYRAYEVSSVTTIEQEFHFRSSQVGFWLSSYDTSHLLVVVVVAYIGGKGHIPRILAGCTLAAAVFMSLGSIPHFLYGADHHDITLDDTNTSQCDSSRELCVTSESERHHGDCDTQNDDRSSSSFSILVVINVCVGLALSGQYSLGLTFIDDNSTKEQAPHFLGIVFSMFAIGHVIGFGLGAGITSMKATQQSIAPWWIGFIVLGLVIMPSAAPLMLIPESYHVSGRKNVIPMKEKDERARYQLLGDNENALNVGIQHKISIAGLFKTIWRLLRNPVYVGMSLLVCAHLLHVSVINSFFPKYIREEFGQHDWTANLYTALKATSAGFGLYFGGFIMTRYNLSIPHTAKLVTVGLVLVNLHFYARLLIGCDTGVSGSIHSSMNGTCAGECNCTQDVFRLVCGADNVTYRSPCHAGCSSSNQCTATGIIEYYNCTCVLNEVQVATDGPCHEDSCTLNLGIYLAITLLGVLVSATTAIPCTVISLRSIRAEDKPVSLALHSVMTSVSAFIPGPVIAGLAIDNACEEWQTKSCEPGALLCRAYNPEKFRLYLHAVACAASALAAILSFFVLYKCNNTMKNNTEQNDCVSIHSCDDDVIENGGRYQQEECEEPQ